MAADTMTYEDIYELLRAEKNSSDLQPLSTDQLAKIKKYLAAKDRLLKKQGSGVFSSVRERAKILSEIDNARCAMRDLFEKREKKIINRAIYTLRADSKLKDTTSMLVGEVELYNHLLEEFEKNRAALAGLIDTSNEPECETLDVVEQKPATTSLKFLEAVQEIIDTELKKHGPFEVGQVASLPTELSNVLIAQKKAETA